MQDTCTIKCSDIIIVVYTQLTHEMGYGTHTTLLHLYLHSMACSRELKDCGLLLRKLCIPAKEAIAVPNEEKGDIEGGRDRR